MLHRRTNVNRVWLKEGCRAERLAPKVAYAVLTWQGYESKTWIHVVFIKMLDSEWVWTARRIQHR